jgi:NADH-quinone oxidoreductase subunit G
MPKLIIDNQEIEVPAGTRVIDAAEQIGIMIPRFCYHPALGSVGACRVCAVKFLEGPIKGVQMSCMIDAAAGMVVSTTDEEAVDFRRHVIEWLMLHHPHDCPVCDEGGHCLLQDMTVSGGHGVRRYRGKKRTHNDQYLGPLVQHEMNRCIQCYRCSRYYQDYSGYRDLGVMGIGYRVYFGRQKEGVLESPFSGNLIDICPTGVYTDKPSRFIGRRWDYERSPSLCLNCSLGCHTVVSTRYRQVVRQEARHSPVVNGHFICDRGRYGFAYASLAARPRCAAVNGEKTPIRDALSQLSQRLSEVSMNSGAGTVACAGSFRSCLETLVALDRSSRKMGWRRPAHWMERATADRVISAASFLDAESAVSLNQVSLADMVLVLGVDPINEAPMLALALRQAQRRGAQVVVLDPRPVSLPFAFRHLPLNPQEIDWYLGSLVTQAADRSAIEALGREALDFFDVIQDLTLPDGDQIDAITAVLKNSRQPLIVCGTDVVTNLTPILAGHAASLLRSEDRKPGLFYVLPGANAFGATLINRGGTTMEEIVTGVEQGAVKALILVECDPLRHFSDRDRLERALADLDLLIVLDYLDTEIGRQAHVFLPTTTLYETGGIYVNQEGRMQTAPPSYCGGLSIAEAGGGSHPPRDYRSDMPGGDPTAAGQLLDTIAGIGDPVGKEVTRATLQNWLADRLPFDGDLESDTIIPEDGLRLRSDGQTAKTHTYEWAGAIEVDQANDDSLELITVERTFGTEELSSFSPHLQAFASEAGVFIHRTDAGRLGLQDGDTVEVSTDRGSVRARASVVDHMRSGLMIVPRLKGLDWQRLAAGRATIAFDRIRKVA